MLQLGEAQCAELGADYAYALASILTSNTRLKSLHLHNHNFSDMGVVVLAKALEVGVQP